MGEFSSLVGEENHLTWTFSVDGASYMKENSTSVMLEGLNYLLIKQSLKFEFKASNNHANHEALIYEMAHCLRGRHIESNIKSYSKLVAK